MGQHLLPSPEDHRWCGPIALESMGSECKGWLCLAVPCSDSNHRWWQSTLVALLFELVHDALKAHRVTYVIGQPDWVSEDRRPLGRSS